MKTIVSLCDRTGIMCEPFKKAGYSILKYDLSEGQDVRLLEFPKGEIAGVISQPPCTNFASSGARWWKKKGEEALLNSLSISDACLRISLVAHHHYNAWWVMENPVGRLSRFINKPSLIFHPYEYAGWLKGDEAQLERYKKQTCLWGNFKHPIKKDLGPHPDKKNKRKNIGICPIG